MSSAIRGSNKATTDEKICSSQSVFMALNETIQLIELIAMTHCPVCSWRLMNPTQIWKKRSCLHLFTSKHLRPQRENAGLKVSTNFFCSFEDSVALWFGCFCWNSLCELFQIYMVYCECFFCDRVWPNFWPFLHISKETFLLNPHGQSQTFL